MNGFGRPHLERLVRYLAGSLEKTQRSPGREKSVHVTLEGTVCHGDPTGIRAKEKSQFQKRSIDRSISLDCKLGRHEHTNVFIVIQRKGIPRKRRLTFPVGRFRTLSFDRKKGQDHQRSRHHSAQMCFTKAETHCQCCKAVAVSAPCPPFLSTRMCTIPKKEYVENPKHRRWTLNKHHSEARSGLQRDKGVKCRLTY